MATALVSRRGMNTQINFGRTSGLIFTQQGVTYHLAFFAMGLYETIAEPFPAILESATIAGGFRFFGLTQRPFITHAASFIIRLVGWQNANDSVCDCGGAAYKGSGRGF